VSVDKPNIMPNAAESKVDMSQISDAMVDTQQLYLPDFAQMDSDAANAEFVRQVAKDGRHDTNTADAPHRELLVLKEVRTDFELKLTQELNVLRNNVNWLVGFQDLKLRSSKNPAGWPFHNFTETERAFASNSALKYALGIVKAVSSLRVLESEAAEHEVMASVVEDLKNERAKSIDDRSSSLNKCKSEYEKSQSEADRILQTTVPQRVKDVEAHETDRERRQNSSSDVESSRVITEAIFRIERAFQFPTGGEHAEIKDYISREVMNRIVHNATRDYLLTDSRGIPYSAETIANKIINSAKSEIDAINAGRQAGLQKIDESKRIQIESIRMKGEVDAARIIADAQRALISKSEAIERAHTDRVFEIDAKIYELEGLIDTSMLGVFPLRRNSQKLFGNVSPKFDYRIIKDFWEAENVEEYVKQFQTDAVRLPTIAEVNSRKMPATTEAAEHDVASSSPVSVNKSVESSNTMMATAKKSEKHKKGFTRRSVLRIFAGTLVAGSLVGNVKQITETLSAPEALSTEQMIPDWLMPSVSAWKPHLDELRSDTRTQSSPVDSSDGTEKRTFDVIKDHPKFILALMAITTGGDPSISGGPLPISSSDTERLNAEFNITPGAKSRDAWMNSLLLAERSANDIFGSIYTHNPQLVDNYLKFEAANIKDMSAAFIELWNPGIKLNAGAKKTFENICRSWSNKSNPIIEDMLGDNQSGPYFRNALDAVNRAGVNAH
jgi:hypothetical protein